ncbi:MAG TPA: DUF2786 domain-containing protein [Pyrinomonadaceae bacterium]|nr:DUF2786 domain-containing protein [Pyrinomonadaceae bacterium]
MSDNERTERIIDKIKKLIRHEQSARQCSTPEEAAAFATRVQELLIKHKIEMSQVSVDEEPETSTVGEETVRSGHYSVRFGRGYVPLEDSRLMRVVAEAHFCAAIGLPGTNTILLVGAEEDRAISVEMFRFLASTMKRQARAERAIYKQRRLSVRMFLPDFYRGFTNTVGRRYRELRQTNACTALVRADALVKRYVESNYETVESQPRKRKGRINRNGYFAGVVAGSQVDLGTNVLGGSNAHSQVS